MVQFVEDGGVENMLHLTFVNKYFRETGSGTKFKSFQLIPFSDPLEGSLRFAPPTPVSRNSFQKYFAL